MSAHWNEIARRWALVGPPLRPSPQDLDFIRDGLAERHAGTPRTLLLGVTPELYRLVETGAAGTTGGTDVLAVDHTPAMIEAIWPGSRNQVVCGDWTCLPLRAASRDVALCDGGLHLLSYPDGQAALVRELRRVLAPGGLCALRLFVPPAGAETPRAVLDDLFAGRIPSLNVLKLRLGMALQPDPAIGVQLSAVWDALHAAAPDLRRLAGQLRWDPEHLFAIDTYRDCPRRYHFVSVAQTCAAFEAGGFKTVRFRVPDSYPLAEQCPTVWFRRAE